MTSKKYILCIASVLYIIMIVNLAFWHVIVKPIFIGRDLNRLGSFATNKPITEDIKYSRHHVRLSDYIASGSRESFDILTIGDSFSSGAYQDYLVNHYGLKIINANRYLKNHCLADLYLMCASGLIDRISPKFVILESVERSVQDRLGREIIVPDTHSDDVKLPTPQQVTISDGFMPPVMFQANARYIYNKFYSFLKPGQLSPEVYITQLDRPFFTNPGQERILLHYCDDLLYLDSPLNADRVNQNLNNAARILKAKGIKLIFFAAADKYDLYYPYIADKSGRTENPFFTTMREVRGKEYVFVDTMKPLREALERGEKDVYWLNDTHWSHKGIKLVCDELVKYILPESR